MSLYQPPGVPTSSSSSTLSPLASFMQALPAIQQQTPPAQQGQMNANPLQLALNAISGQTPGGPSPLAINSPNLVPNALNQLGGAIAGPSQQMPWQSADASAPGAQLPWQQASPAWDTNQGLGSNLITALSTVLGL